ncbi:MAG: carbohydrate kinase family protein [Patescibacteria group bacterium]|nr:carbohydrate kinase family protein [Patescibacteria group bacterium]
MLDIITIGAVVNDVYVFSKRFHVMPDLHTRTGKSECFAFGTKIELDDIFFEIGGGATNAAETFRLQGLRTGCITRIGKDSAGADVQKYFRSAGIADFSIIDSTHRTAHSVIFLNGDGERTILVYRGASHNFRTRDIHFSVLRKARWLYVTSLAGNISVFSRIIKFAAAHGIRTMVNPGMGEIRGHRKQLIKILKECDIILLNREEAGLVTEHPHYNIKAILGAFARICPRNIVLISDGVFGSYACLNGVRYRVIIQPVHAVDTTGAGDAFGSGFLAGYIKSRGNIEKALILASNNAALTVKKIGAKHDLLRTGMPRNIARCRITRF